MKRSWPLLSIVTLFVMACGTGHAPSGAPCPSDTPSASSSAAPKAKAPEIEAPRTLDIPAIDAWVTAEVKKRELVGLSLAIVHEGKIVLAKGYGKKSIKGDDAVTPDTAFAIGSVTKQLTCASVLLLAEAGKLSIDDKIAKYFPDLQRANDVTLHDLMSHVAGYPDYYPLDFVDERMTKATTVEAVVKDYGKRPLDFEPHTRFSYSNTGFLVAGLVVEKLSGEPFDAFVGKKIFEPLAMKRSGFDAKALGDVATGHTAFQAGDTEIATPEAAGWLQAAGAAYSTAGDLARWDLGLLDKKILSPKSFDAMTTPARLADGTPVPYACGLATWQRNGETILQHNGAVSGFLAWNGMIPRTRSAVVLLSNAEHLEARSIHAEILSLLAITHDGRRPPAIAGPPAAQVAKELFRQMQRGELDRTKLGAEFSAYMTDARVKAAAPRLAALGEPIAVRVEDVGERGRAENASIRIELEKKTLRAVMHRSADGKVQQFLLSR